MIYAIIGPTCVGKTDLSIKLAKKINAEIINCDSMQIYKEFKIGVAKITESEKQNIKHHLFDIVSIKDDFSVFDYQYLARKKINELLIKRKNIVIVGGTGLYLKALLYNYTFTKNEDSNQNELIYKNVKIIGLTKNREKLYNDINKRVDKMISSGILEEVKRLYDKNINTRPVKFAIGYKELYDYYSGKKTLSAAINDIKTNSRHYAKRQYTFFNHQFNNIKWYNVDEMSIKDICTDIIK